MWNQWCKCLSACFCKHRYVEVEGLTVPLLSGETVNPTPGLLSLADARPAPGPVYMDMWTDFNRILASDVFVYNYKHDPFFIGMELWINKRAGGQVTLGTLNVAFAHVRTLLLTHHKPFNRVIIIEWKEAYDQPTKWAEWFNPMVECWLGIVDRYPTLRFTVPGEAYYQEDSASLGHLTEAQQMELAMRMSLRES